MSAAGWQQRPVNYAQRLDERDPASVELVVIHCTELPDLAMAREYAERVHYPDSQTGNCGHLYLDRSGELEQWVPLNRIAHHVRGHNQASVGIELVNLGRYPHWLDAAHQQMTEPYPELQLAALLKLLQALGQQLPSLAFIAGHAELDREQVAATDQPDILVQRKLDPGPLFPWPRVLSACGLERLRC